MSSKIKLVNGSGPTEMKTGSLMKMGIWQKDMPVLTTWKSRKKKESLNNVYMKDNLFETDGSKAAEPIVIADECGDTMWDAVLAQETKVSELTGIPTPSVDSSDQQLHQK